MNELHSYRSLTDTRCHALDRTMAHIAYRKDAGNIGLEQKGIAFQCPTLGMLPLAHEVWPGQQKAAIVALHHSVKKIRARQSSDKDKHRTRRHTLNLIGIGTEHRDFFQMSFPVGFDHAGISPKLNIRRLLNLVDQVL